MAIVILNTFWCWKVILVIHGFANSSEVVSPDSGAGITCFGGKLVELSWVELALSWFSTKLQKLSWVEQVNKLCLFHSTFEPGLTRLRITGISRHRYIHHHLHSWSPNSTLISTDKYKRHSRHRYIHQTPSLIIIPLMIVTGQQSSSNSVQLFQTEHLEIVSETVATYNEEVTVKSD